MALIGDNRPPGATVFAAETFQEVSKFLEDHPVIQNEDDARAGKLLIDRIAGSWDEIERERDRLVRPLNEQVKTINDRYREPKSTLNTVKDILLERLGAFIQAEKQRLEKEAEAKRRLVEDAERRAREAEDAEQRAREESGHGVAHDISAITLAADRDFASYQSALREAARAEKATDVKLGGGFRRRLGLRKTEVLVLQDWNAAISDMGVSETLTDAILKEAKAYRKSTGTLPAGIISTTEESL